MKIRKRLFIAMGTGRFPKTLASVSGGNRIGNAFPVGRASAAFGGKPNPPHRSPDLVESRKGFGPLDTLREFDMQVYCSVQASSREAKVALDLRRVERDK